jgi:hypothetical protein
MFDPAKLSSRQTKPLDSRQTGGPSFAGIDVGNFMAGPADNLAATPPVYRGANNIIACEFLTATRAVTWANIWHHDVGRLGGEHFDSVYIRNQKIGQRIIIRDCLADHIAGGFVLMEAGCAGTLELLGNECRNVGYPRPVTIKPTSAANRITLYMDGNVRCHVQIDTSKLVAGQRVTDCLTVYLGTNPDTMMPDWAAMGIMPIALSSPPNPHIGCNQRIGDLENALAAARRDREAAMLEAKRQIERNALLSRVVETELVTIEQRIAFLREALR